MDAPYPNRFGRRQKGTALKSQQRVVEFFRHNIEAEDIARLQEVFDSIFLTTGTATAEFEEKFAAYIGIPFAVGVTSCTAALHLALLALEIGPGDEVITTPMTFLATATAVLHAGATPVFVDVEPDTGLIDPTKIQAAITPRTKAILPVHLYGMMADMRAIAAIAQKHHLKIIEDCAHCIEGERDGIRPGMLSDAACYSFYATKNLACGEGGAVASRSQDFSKKIRLLRQHGISADAASRYGQQYRHWDMGILGWKYNMDNIHAALLICQIDRLDGYLARREAISRRYEQAFSSAPRIRIPKVYGKSARHLQTIWVDPDRRDQMMWDFQQNGVGVGCNYRAVHTLKYFRKTFNYQPSDFPEAYRIGLSTITLPLYPKLTDDAVDYVINVTKKVITPG